MNDNHILKVVGLKKYFPIESGFFRQVTGHVKAVDGINFAINKGETFGLVGESGCGKTTTAKVVIRLLEPADGNIYFRNDEEIVDIASLEARELQEVWRNMFMVFQDPFASLNPRMSILDIIAEPMLARGYERRVCEERVEELLNLVGLDPKHMRRYPHAFSGGQRQRIGVARALALNPSLVIADEPVSALDVSVQAQILNLLEKLQEEINLSYLFIAHDLSVVRYIADRVAVMYLGQLVELAATNELYENPLHPYTSGLLRAVPVADPNSGWLTDDLLSGEVEETRSEVQGCAFSPRCPYALDKCRDGKPEFLIPPEVQEAHYVACYRASELNLAGIA